MVSGLQYSYLVDEQLDDETMAVLGEVPGRWGRMDALSRLAVVEVGRVLRREKLLPGGRRISAEGPRAGLIIGSRYGSLATDLEFAGTTRQGCAMASPMLFGYTLANIAPAEAAGHFGLTGPVYAVFADDPLRAAEEEAGRWLSDDPGLAFMVAGELDFFSEQIIKAGSAGLPFREAGSAAWEVSVKINIVRE